MLLAKAPVSAKSSDLDCVLNPGQYDTEASLRDQIFGLDQASSAVMFGTEASDNTFS